MNHQIIKRVIHIDLDRIRRVNLNTIHIDNKEVQIKIRKVMSSKHLGVINP